MGGYPPHGTGTGGFPIPCGAATYREAVTEEVGRRMGVHRGRGDKRGGGVQADGNLHYVKAEYGFALYFNATDSGPVRGREEVRGRGGDAVVGTGRA